MSLLSRLFGEDQTEKTERLSVEKRELVIALIQAREERDQARKERDEAVVQLKAVHIKIRAAWTHVSSAYNVLEEIRKPA